MSDDPIPGLDSPPPASPFRMDITPIRTNQVNLFFSPANEEDEQPPNGRGQSPQAYTRTQATPQVYTRKARAIVEDDDDEEDDEPAPPSKRPRNDRLPPNAAARLAASRRPADAQTSALSLFDDDPPSGATQGQLETFDPLLGPVGMMNGRSGEGDEDGEGTGKRKRVLPKFNAERLLSDRGLPALIKDVKKFRIRGKGHEAKDLANLLSTYQMWAHQLFPKMPFSETVTRVEVLCHTTLVKNALRGYKERDKELREALFRSPTPPPATGTMQQTTTTAEHGEAPLDDAPNGEMDLPDDEEDYEAMIAAAEAEAAEAQQNLATKPARPAHANDDDDDDFEAMIAAAEVEAAEPHAAIPPAKTVEKSVPEGGDEYDDDWAAMDGM